MKMPLNFFKLPKKKKRKIQLEGRGRGIRETKRGIQFLRLEEMIFFFFFQTPESRYCFTTPQFDLTREEKKNRLEGRRKRLGRDRE
jgi:hypothetical protein